MDDHPWLVRVADLGWADAWVDLGFTNKAFRQYLAPERLESIVVPEKSDVFAIGVILAELLLGQHPASNFKKATKSEGNWKKCIEKAEWILQDIDSDRLRRLVSICLDSDPDKRPSPAECLHEICTELSDQHSVRVLETLDLWSRERSAIESAEHSAWAAAQVIDLSTAEVAKEESALTEKLRSISVVGFSYCEIWIALAESMVVILNRGTTGGAEDSLSSLRDEAIHYLTSLLAPATSSAVIEWGNRPDWLKSVRPFERYSEMVGRMAVLAYGSYGAAYLKVNTASSYFWAALSFAEASEAHSRPNTPLAIQLIGKAIGYFSTEAVLYYFRAIWAEQQWTIDSIRATGRRETTDYETRAVIIADLKKAIEFDPNWDEPRSRLEELLSTNQ